MSWHIVPDSKRFLISTATSGDTIVAKHYSELAGGTTKNDSRPASAERRAQGEPELLRRGLAGLLDVLDGSCRPMHALHSKFFAAAFVIGDEKFFHLLKQRLV